MQVREMGTDPQYPSTLYLFSIEIPELGAQHRIAFDHIEILKDKRPAAFVKLVYKRVELAIEEMFQEITDEMIKDAKQDARESMVALCTGLLDKVHNNLPKEMKT